MYDIIRTGGVTLYFTRTVIVISLQVFVVCYSVPKIRLTECVLGKYGIGI